MKTKAVIGVGFMVGVIILALLLAPQSHQALAQAQFKLKFQATWPAGSTLFDNFKMFCEMVKKMSGGRLEIEPLPAGAVVPPFELLDAVSRGVLDGGHAWASYWYGKRKVAGLFTGGPGGTFGMDFTDYMGWMYEGGGLELYNEFYQKILGLKIKAWPILPSAPQSFGWFKNPVKSWEDMKGVKMRIGGMAGEIFQRAGLRVVNIPGGEIVPAAERGVIDAAEWVTPGEDMKMGFHEIWKNYYMPGIHENTSVGELLFNTDVWNKLPGDLQAIVDAATITTFVRWQSWFLKYNALALKDLREKYGVTIHRTPDDILIACLKNWDEIAKAESEKDPFFKKVLDSQREFASLMVPAHRFMYPPYAFCADYYWPEKK